MDKKELFDELNKVLLSLGFHKRSSTWFLQEGECINLINLQRSNYASLYYVNLGIYFTKLGSEQYPKQEACHLTLRMANSFTGHAIDYDYLFDLEQPDIGVEQLRIALTDCVHHVMLPQLELMKTKEGLLSLTKTTPAILHAVPLRTKSYLGIIQ